MRLTIKRCLLIVSVLGSMQLWAGCDSTGPAGFPDPTQDDPSSPSTTDGYLATVSVAGAQASYDASPAPPGSMAAPIVSAPIHFDPGATVTVEIFPPDGATEALISVDTAESGHFRVPLVATQAMQSATFSGRKIFGSNLEDPGVFVELSPEAAFLGDGMTLLIATTDGQSVSQPAVHHLHRRDTTAVSPLHVQLVWSQSADFDLHLRLPTEREVYWGAPRVDGGVLDADAAANCGDATSFAESIEFAQAPPVGTYEVRAALWDACSTSGSLEFEVIVTRGERRTVYEGGFSAEEAEPGAEGAGVLVTRFVIE